MSDTPNRRSGSPLTLVVRAAFVPDGQQPPPEFASVFDPIKFPATLDPATGMITCDNAGVSFDGDVRAEWHPDGSGDSYGGEERSGQPGGSDGQIMPFAQIARADGKKANDAVGGNTNSAIGTQTISSGAGRPPGMLPAGPGSANAPPNFNRFFDTLDQPLGDLAKELGVPEDYLLGHAAYESGYLGDHDFPLNNPFGYTKAGGRNLAFPSISDAVAAYRKDYASQIKGATTAKDFVARLQGRLNDKPMTGWHKYNSSTAEYESNVLRVIESISRHEAEWRKQKEPVR